MSFSYDMNKEKYKVEYEELLVYNFQYTLDLNDLLFQDLHTNNES